MSLRLLVAIMLMLGAFWYWVAVVAFVLMSLSDVATRADETSGMFALGMCALCAAGAAFALKRRL